MSAKLLGLIKDCYPSTKTEVRASGDDLLSFGINSSSTTLSTGFLAKLGQVGTNVHASDLAFTDDIVLLSNSYREMQGLLEAVGMRINTSKTKVMPALIPGEQCQAIPLDGEPLVTPVLCLSLIRGLLLPAWATTIKADLKPLSGPRVSGCAR